MKKSLKIILILYLFSCSESNKPINQRVENRIIYVYHSDEARPVLEYELTISKKDTTTEYYYRNFENPKKDIFFSFYPISNQLRFFKENFFKSDNAEFIIPEIGSALFTIYKSNGNIIDGTNPILFNSEYGVLGIGNGYGPDAVILKYDNLELVKSVKDVINRNR